MKRADNDYKLMIWTPIIGFDMNQPDRGVDQYYRELGFVPDQISLFLFAPDIIHLHENMDTELPLAPDNCNYYGNIRNEKRAIQPWTNHKLRELVNNITARGTDVYAGIMGVYFNEDHSRDIFYNSVEREWLEDHRELMQVCVNSVDCINVLKRFNDGTYYEDFLLEKLKVMLPDYGFKGLHTADGFCPTTGNAGLHTSDYSDDIVAQFVEHTGLKLPSYVLQSVADTDHAGLRVRADYIWNRLRREWIEFHAWRWGQFWSKISGGLHQIDKKVMTNNSWCSEPFESLYRFGIDYRTLYESGVDCIVTESQAAAVNSSPGGDDKYRLHQYMTMPMLMRAYAPAGEMLCISGVKDSTEEWNAIEHLPSAVEREIYTVANMYYQKDKQLERATDGISVCLGDGITEEEWRWQSERWDIGFSQPPKQVLTPTLVWSDTAVHDFLDHYITTRRWSFHKTAYELAEHGAQFASITRVENLQNVRGAIFVPNADILPDAELQMVASYKGGAIICTAVEGELANLPGLGEPDIYFADPCSGFPLCIFAYNMPDISYKEVLSGLGDGNWEEAIASPEYTEESPYFLFALPFQKASTGFVASCAKLVRELYKEEIYADPSAMLIPLVYGDNKIRILVGNENRLQYGVTRVNCRRSIKSVQNRSKFPALPVKVLNSEGGIIVPKSESNLIPENVHSFLVKTVPGGLTILDVELNEE